METTTLSTVSFPLVAITPKIPNGQYHVAMVAALRVVDVLNVQFEIRRGPFAGRYVYAAFNFSDHKSRNFLGSWLNAAGRVYATDTSEMAGLVVLATVRTQNIDGIGVAVVSKFSKPLWKDGK